MATQFRCVDAAVVRVAVFGSELDLPPWPDLTGSAPEYVEEWRSWLRLVWQQEALVEAIEVASPVLARRVGDVCGGQVQQPRRVRRVVESAVRYLLRLTSRATPFGLFAGVAPLRLGSTASVRWGERHRAVTRPDAAWLAEVIAQLEARPDVRTHLPVMANNLGFVRGDRLVVPCQQPPGIPGKVRPGDVSVRHTRAVQTVIQAARSPITIGDLIAKLAAELPGKPLAKIQKILTELVSCRILVTSLHPPMDVTDPLGHVIEQLTAMETGAAPLSVVRELRAISGQLSRDDQVSAPGARRALRASVSQQMSAICDRPEPSLAVDLRVDCSVVLPQAVAREAEAAASALVRLRPHRFGNPAWRAWHTRFLERYGSGAVVPVDQVVDADTGLGYPAGYRGSLMTPPAPPTLARDRKLLHLAQRAALDGGGEVVLDEHVLSELAADSTGAPPPHGPPHTELRFSLHAPTTEVQMTGHRDRHTRRQQRCGMVKGSAEGLLIGWLPVVDPQDDAGVATQLDVAFGHAARTPQRYEAAFLDPPAPPVSILALESDRTRQTPHPQRDDQPAAWSQLVHPGRWQVPRTRGDDDPVIRRMACVAELTITTEHRHVPVAGGGQALAGPPDDLAVDVDRRDLACRADQMREQRRVVTRTGTDLQDPVSRLDVELLQHQRHDSRCRGRTDSYAVSVAMRDDVLVRVSPLGRGVRDEQVSRYRTHRRLDRCHAHQPIPPQPVDHQASQLCRGGGSSRVDIHLGSVRRPLYLRRADTTQRRLGAQPVRHRVILGVRCVRHTCWVSFCGWYGTRTRSGHGLGSSAAAGA